MKMIKTLTASEKVTAALISKARKPKGVAQWAKLEPLKDKLEGKHQAHIQFTSYNPKAYGKKRTLASKNGALDFLMGYVSPRFFVAPYHLQIINPDLSDEAALEWLIKMGHPSKISPAADQLTEPEGDVNEGYCHDSVGGLYPGKQISLAGEVTKESTDELAEGADGAPGAGPKDTGATDGSPGTSEAVLADEHPIEPAFVESHDEHPEQTPGKPSDLLMACPFGGGSRCRAQGGSGSPFHHVHSDSMTAHLAKLQSEGANIELPKLGSFKGEPAMFFSHKGQPYVAVPTRQEVHAKNGAVYKWSFLSEGPLALANPMLAKVMNQLAPKKPVIIPNWDIPETIITIAHDAVPSEDPQDCAFINDVYPLIKDFFPRPGSAIPLGIVKGEKVYAVVTDRSLDFYTEEGQDTYFQGADGLYYAYFDLTGKDTPAIVLISFINVYFSHIDTTPLEQQVQSQEDATAEALYGEPSLGYDDVPAEPPVKLPYSGMAKPDDPVFGKLVNTYDQHIKLAVKQSGSLAVAKPAHWEAFDLPPLAVWIFAHNNEDWALVQLATNAVGGKVGSEHAVPVYVLVNSQMQGIAEGSLFQCLAKIGLNDLEPEVLLKVGLLNQEFPAGCTTWSVRDGSFDSLPLEEGGSILKSLSAFDKKAHINDWPAESGDAYTFDEWICGGVFKLQDGDQLNFSKYKKSHALMLDAVSSFLKSAPFDLNFGVEGFAGKWRRVAGAAFADDGGKTYTRNEVGALILERFGSPSSPENAPFTLVFSA